MVRVPRDEMKGEGQMCRFLDAGARASRALAPSVLLLAVTFWPGKADAATDVSGTISTNTTWTLAGSPYNLTGDVTIDPGVTLTVESAVTVTTGRYDDIRVNGTLTLEAGTTVSMYYDSYIYVNGTLSADGVAFNGSSSSPYSHIEFRAASSGTLSNCAFNTVLMYSYSPNLEVTGGSNNRIVRLRGDGVSRRTPMEAKSGP